MFRPMQPRPYWPVATPFYQSGYPPYGAQQNQPFPPYEGGFPPYWNQGQFGSQSGLQGMNGPGYYNPYNPFPYSQFNQPPSITGAVMNSFKTPDGQFDMNKAVNTFGQLVNTFQSAAPIVKQVGSFLMK